MKSTLNNKKRGLVSQYKRIKNSWTVHHPREIIIASLILVILIQAYGTVINNRITHVANAFTDEIYYSKGVDKTQATLEAEIKQQVDALFIERADYFKEQLRQEVIRDKYEELLYITEVSPYVDYDALQEQYGY